MEGKKGTETNSKTKHDKTRHDRTKYKTRQDTDMTGQNKTTFTNPLVGPMFATCLFSLLDLSRNA